MNHEVTVTLDEREINQIGVALIARLDELKKRVTTCEEVSKINVPTITTHADSLGVQALEELALTASVVAKIERAKG